MFSVIYFYLSGILLALAVFATTYFHRQIGMIFLIAISALSFIQYGNLNYDGNINSETGQNLLAHWNFSCRLTFFLAIALFFAAIILKRELKRKSRKD